MTESNGFTDELIALEKRIGELARSVRRQSIALWALLAALLLLYGSPWIFYLVQSIRYSDTRGIPSADSRNEKLRPVEQAWDNDFSSRTPEDKVERASAILLTRVETDGVRQRQVVAEILQRRADVRLYFKVGDKYESRSHAPSLDCAGCEGDGLVVFLLGNPATAVEASTYEGGRIMAMGDMPLEEIRRLVAASAAKPR